MEVILPYRKSKLVAYFSLLGVGLAFVSLALQWWSVADSLPLDGFYGMVRIEGLPCCSKESFWWEPPWRLLSPRAISYRRRAAREYYALVLFCYCWHDVLASAMI